MAGGTEVAPVRVRRDAERMMGARDAVDHGGVVEFVADQFYPCPPQYAVVDEARDPVAEMKLAPGVAGRDRQQAGHRMHAAVLVLQRPAQRHVAAALAVDRPRARERSQPVEKRARARETAGVQLRIAAGKPAGAAVAGRRFVREWGERLDLGPGRPPPGEDVRIDE